MREVRVESTFDELSAGAAASALSAAGIPVRIIREDAALAIAGPTLTGGFHILVPDTHEAQARRVLGTDQGRR
ncbi:MAG TPA: DUF2007 domain-containing protein [Candidatus Limnocylindria bacterium]|jgi:hypothetical protein